MTGRICPPERSSMSSMTRRSNLHEMLVLNWAKKDALAGFQYTFFLSITMCKKGFLVIPFLNACRVHQFYMGRKHSTTQEWHSEHCTNLSKVEQLSTLSRKYMINLVHSLHNSVWCFLVMFCLIILLENLRCFPFWSQSPTRAHGAVKNRFFLCLMPNTSPEWTVGAARKA